VVHGEAQGVVAQVIAGNLHAEHRAVVPAFGKRALHGDTAFVVGHRLDRHRPFACRGIGAVDREQVQRARKPGVAGDALADRRVRSGLERAQRVRDSQAIGGEPAVETGRACGSQVQGLRRLDLAEALAQPRLEVLPLRVPALLAAHLLDRGQRGDIVAAADGFPHAPFVQLVVVGRGRHGIEAALPRPAGRRPPSTGRSRRRRRRAASHPGARSAAPTAKLRAIRVALRQLLQTRGDDLAAALVARPRVPGVSVGAAMYAA
jgi:hypothetical protein